MSELERKLVRELEGILIVLQGWQLLSTYEQGRHIDALRTFIDRAKDEAAARKKPERTCLECGAPLYPDTESAFCSAVCRARQAPASGQP